MAGLPLKQPQQWSEALRSDLRRVFSMADNELAQLRKSTSVCTGDYKRAISQQLHKISPAGRAELLRSSKKEDKLRCNAAVELAAAAMQRYADISDALTSFERAVCRGYSVQFAMCECTTSASSEDEVRGGEESTEICCPIVYPPSDKTTLDRELGNIDEYLRGAQTQSNQDIEQEGSDEIQRLNDEKFRLLQNWHRWKKFWKINFTVFPPLGTAPATLRNRLASCVMVAPDLSGSTSTPLTQTPYAFDEYALPPDDKLDSTPLDDISGLFDHPEQPDPAIQEVVGLRCIKVDQPIRRILNKDAFIDLLNALADCADNTTIAHAEDGTEDGIVEAIELLAQAKLCTPPELGVVLSVASAEALCGLDSKDFIGKGVLDFLTLLHPLPKREEFRKHMRGIQEYRNKLVHSNLNRLAYYNQHIGVIAQCIVKRAQLSNNVPETRGRPLKWVFEQYMCGNNKAIRNYLDRTETTH